MRDYNKEAEAVCKMRGASKWEMRVYLTGLPERYTELRLNDEAFEVYEMDSTYWMDLVKQATQKEEKMTNDELDDLLEELYSSEEFLVEMEHRLEELRGSQERTIEVIEEVERRIKVIRDKLRGA